VNRFIGFVQPQETCIMTIGRSIFTLAAGAAMPLLAASAAFAHAHLVRATPAVGTTVHEAPSEILLRFNEKLEPSFSTVVVRDPVGKQVDKADAQVDKSDRLQMRVSLPPLTPGVYKVEWRVMSADTHKVNGNFSFTVGQ
jgi:methionine-rich copper-binding protein CopC